MAWPVPSVIFHIYVVFLVKFSKHYEPGRFLIQRINKGEKKSLRKAHRYLALKKEDKLSLSDL